MQLYCIKYHVVYNTNKCFLTKSGYVNYEGTGGARVDTDIVITEISHSQIKLQQYGTSSKCIQLNVYKIGNSSKVLFAGLLFMDGKIIGIMMGLVLVKIANKLTMKIADYMDKNINLHI